MDGKVLIQKPRGISRKLTLVLILCLSMLVCLLTVSHGLAVTKLKVSEGQIARASPWVRSYVVMSHPVEDWERDLYDRFKAGGLSVPQLGYELSMMWRISLEERDVEAWRERMAVDSCSLELFGFWFYVPGLGSLRSLYRAYGEYTVLLGASAFVAYYAYLKPLLRRRGVGSHGETPK